MGNTAPPSPYSIRPYTPEIFRQILAEEADVPPSVVARKQHVAYFVGYLQNLGAKTILVERQYIDRDFLEDFASYYVRCFADYRHVCSRLHFFDQTVSDDELCTAINGENLEKLSTSYLGFIVVKPLPQTIFGRTCLRTYEDDNGRRHYLSVRSYEANVFGIELEVKNTLAFQEQDKVAAACATSALWSAFQATGKLFQHPIPSPVDITKAATTELPRESRTFPNNGLALMEMAHAIRSINLEPLMVRANMRDILKGNAYAYLKAKIPLLLIVDVYDAKGYDAEKNPLHHQKKPSYRGKHAVAATGYSLGLSVPSAFGPSGILLKSSRIDKLYAHDDQVGPFARMVFTELVVSYGASELQQDFLITSWRDPITGEGNVVAQPENLLIPLYHKVRIPYETIIKVVIDFDTLLEELRSRNMAPLSARLEWDVYLTTINEFKSEVRESNDIRQDERASILLKPLPRFLWCATGSIGGKRAIGLLFDATDIEQGRFFLRAIGYDSALAQFLTEFAKSLPDDPPIVPRQTLAILRHFAKR